MMASRVRPPPQGRQAGFSLFELIVVICIVALLAGLLLNRLQFYQEAAEKAVMQQTAAAIKSALQMRVASYMIAGRDNEIDKLRNENPVNFLQEKPDNYAGEFRGDAYLKVTPGSWYFDSASLEFVYTVQRADNFKPGPDGRKWIRYRVRIVYEDVSGSGTPPKKVLVAATFGPVQAYRWF